MEFPTITMSMDEVDALRPSELADNLVKLWDAANTAERREGRAWYSDARNYSRRIARRYGVTLHQAVGAVAALSPRLQWHVNMEAARRAVARERIGLGLGLGQGRAAAIVRGDDAPLAILGGPKVRAFYRTILDPATSDHVVVDVWMLRALLGGAYVDDATAKRMLSRYGKMAEAVRIAARRRSVPQSTMQAVTWITVQRVTAAQRAEVRAEARARV